MLVDKSNNKTDVPHDYVELEKPVQARFIKLENIHMPTGKFAISGLRVFGNGNGAKPDAVKDFIVLRTEKDKRSGWYKMETGEQCLCLQYLLWNCSRINLYNCIMVHDNNEYWLKAMDKLKTYYFALKPSMKMVYLKDQKSWRSNEIFNKKEYCFPIQECNE